jgi:hypothetical protein
MPSQCKPPIAKASLWHRVVSLALGMLACTAHADSWRPASIQARASTNGQFVVRVVPGTSKGDLVGFAGEPKGPFATAEWHRFNGISFDKVASTALLNPIAPVDIEVTNEGVLVTFDNWHNLGHGAVVAIYTPGGSILKKYGLPDLYSKSDLSRIQTSVSSIHWRCGGAFPSLERKNELWVDDSLGGRFIFALDTGAFEYLRNGGSCR